MCNAGAANHMLHGPAGAEWQAQFGHELEAAISDPKCGGAQGSYPCYSAVTSNRYCKIGKFCDASAATVLGWHALLAGNAEAPCRGPAPAADGFVALAGLPVALAAGPAARLAAGRARTGALEQENSVSQIGLWYLLCSSITY